MHANATSSHSFDHQVAALELEGEVLDGFVTDAIGRLTTIAGTDPTTQVHRIVDLGSGPGVSTPRLATAFPAATVVAADNSRPMLERVVARATQDGIAGRVETAVVDLDGDLGPSVREADLLWASMSLHHVSDEQAVVEKIRAALRPGGLVCIIERGDVSKIGSSDEIGRPGVWDRLDDAWKRWFQANVIDHGHGHGHGPSSYGARLEASGFEVLADDTLDVTLGPPLTGPAEAFVRRHLERRLHALDGNADADDLAAAAAWLAAGPTWDDASYRETRRLSIGRRP